MGKPLSMDLRERVVAAIEGGMSTRQAAERFSVGAATSGAWARRKRATGDVAPAEAIEATGAQLLYLPPYSPDFNPIENAFSKLKAHVRKVAARACDALWDAIADALDQVTPAECANFFAHAGYDLD